MAFEKVSATSVADVLFGRAGLIIGPGATVNDGIYGEIAERFGIDSSGGFSGIRALSQAIRDNGFQDEEARRKFEEYYSGAKKSPLLRQLCQPNWKSVTSLSVDSFFEDGMQMVADRKVARKKLTVVTDLTAGFPRRTVPAFKLLGSLTAGYSLFEEEILSVRPRWRVPLSAFCDELSGSPAICVGLASETGAFLDLLSEMLAEPRTRPSSLIFLADDPILQNGSVIRLIGNRLRVYQFSDSMASLISEIAAQEKVGKTRLLFYADREDKDVLNRYDDVCKQVKQINQSGNKIPKEALLESLFSPSTTEWLPFEQELDFRRSIELNVIEAVKKAVRDQTLDHNAVLLTGSAANGKTTLLKRAAYELASEGSVFWFTATPVGASDRLFADLFRAIKATLTETPRLILFVDDPLRSRRGEVDHILANAVSEGFRTTLVVGVRSSEWANVDTFNVVGRSTIWEELVLEDEFTEQEYDNLRPYLIKIEAAHDDDSARARLGNLEHRDTRDVLNTLYLAVPSTRPVILASLRDEYVRLLSRGGLRDVVKGAMVAETTQIRRAYEFTAVANLYGAELPIEVLREAIDLDWDHVKDFLASNSALWGLLYPVENASGIALNARNQIVVDTIVSMVNGGPDNRSGEIRLLRQLVNACAGHSAGGYRGFLAKLLINNPTLKRISYEDGLDIFEDAIAALPTLDRALMHHKGQWMADHQKPSEALVAYREALAAPRFPYSDGGESDANILTSMAASVVAEIRSGKKEREQGKREAAQLLSRAKTESVANPYVVHVNANLALELVRVIPVENVQERLELVTGAVGEIDKLAMLEESPISFRYRSKKSSTLLESARTDLYREAVHGHDHDEFAEKIWSENQKQDGFIISARSKLKTVRESPKPRGRDFQEVYAFCEECRRRIHEVGQVVDSRLSQVQIETFYWWRIYRAMLSPLESEIQWGDLLSLLAEMDLDSSDKSNVFLRFLQAYALAHLGEWDQAESIFGELRSADLPPDILFLPRGFLLDEKGGRTTLQGVVREYAGKRYLEVNKLKKSFITERKDRWSSVGELDHANILFTFAGPRAVHDS